MTSVNNVGTHVPALVVRRVLAAEDHPGALFDSGSDVVLHPGLLALSDQRADVGRLVGGIADLQARHHVGQRVDNLIAAPLADQDAGLSYAGLPVVHQACGLQFPDRLTDVGVVENDRRRLAAELEAHPLELLTAQRGDAASDRTGPGERHLVHTGMAHQRLAHIGAAGKDGHHPFGQVQLLDHLGQPQSVQRCFGRGFDDDRAAGDQRGYQLGHDQELRHVPWHDRRDHPDRGPVQVHFAEHAVAPFGPGKVAGDPQGEVDHRHRRGSLAQPAETARRAHLVGDQVGHLVEVAAVDGRELLDLAHAFLRAEPRPRSMVEGVPSGGNRVVDVRGRRRGNVANRTFGVRGDDRKALIGGRLTPLPADEKLVVATVVTGFRHKARPLKRRWQLRY